MRTGTLTDTLHLPCQGGLRGAGRPYSKEVLKPFSIFFWNLFQKPGVGAAKFSSKAICANLSQDRYIVHSSASQTLASIRIIGDLVKIDIWAPPPEPLIRYSQRSRIIYTGTSSQGMQMLVVWGPRFAIHLPTDTDKEFFRFYWIL